MFANLCTIEYNAGYWNNGVLNLKELTLDEKIDFFTEFNTYIKSSVPISTSLTNILKFSSNPKIKEISSKILKNVDKSKNFSESILNFKNALGSAYCGLLSAGFEAGKLQNITSEILNLLKKQRTLRRKIIKSGIYPFFIFIFIVIFVIALFTIIVPKVAMQAEIMRGDLPLSLKILNIISKIITKGWIILIPLIIILINFSIKSLKKSFNSESGINNIIYGKIVKMYNISMFTKVLAVSYSAGIPAVSAYILASKIVENSFMKNKLINSSALLGEKKISDALFETGLFTGQMISKIASGEETGNVDDMLNEISSDTDENMDTIIASSIQIMQPLLILVLGFIVIIIGYIILGPANPLNYL